MAIWDFLSGNASQIIDSVGNAIDKLTTTDEEKEKLKNELAKEMNGFKLAVMQAQNDYEKELTERQKNDMTSDNWLSKSIRPLLLLILTISTIILAYATIFLLTPEEVVKVKVWIPLLTTLLTTGFIFYFGSRGFEKIQKIKKD
jgi:uncharacterized membrane protein (DUF106 family)